MKCPMCVNGRATAEYDNWYKCEKCKSTFAIDEAQHLMMNSEESIYSSVPGWVLTPGKYDRNEILQALKNHKGTYLTAKELAKRAGYPEKGTQVTLRKDITTLIESAGIPIISNTQGFKLATTQQELEYYKTLLEVRMRGLQKRITSVDNIIRGGI